MSLFGLKEIVDSVLGNMDEYSELMESYVPIQVDKCHENVKNTSSPLEQPRTRKCDCKKMSGSMVCLNLIHG